MPKIVGTSVFVDDQDKALAFCTAKPGFVKKHDVPAGQHRWLTVVSPGDPDGTELLPEPNGHPAAGAYQANISADGIPAAMFGVEDLQWEYERLTDAGVMFTMPPAQMGDVTIAIPDDTCGNRIRLIERQRQWRQNGRLA